MAPVVTTGEKTGTILVDDDDDGVTTVLGKWVSAFGHQVHVAPDADRALEILGETHVDVALCDMRMPRHDGVWLVDQCGSATCAWPSSSPRACWSSSPR
jgi:CheY-like chemotaxis protein